MRLLKRHPLSLIPAHRLPGYQKFTLEDVVHKDDIKNDTPVIDDFAKEWYIVEIERSETELKKRSILCYNRILLQQNDEIYL